MNLLPNDYAVIFEYEQYLAGVVPKLSLNVFKTDDEVICTKEHNAIVIIQYAVFYYLGWDAETTACHFNENVIEKLKLKEAYKHLEFPTGLDKKKDYWYVAHILFPNHYKTGTDDLAIIVYKNILSKKDGRIPKGFTDGDDGKKRACKCLNYVLNNLYITADIEDLYYIFSDKEKCNEFLEKFKLTIMCKKTFYAPIDLLFSTLNESQRNYELYHYCRFHYYFS